MTGSVILILLAVAALCMLFSFFVKEKKYRSRARAYSRIFISASCALFVPFFGVDLFANFYIKALILLALFAFYLLLLYILKTLSDDEYRKEVYKRAYTAYIRGLAVAVCVIAVGIAHYLIT